MFAALWLWRKLIFITPFVRLKVESWGRLQRNNGVHKAPCPYSYWGKFCLFVLSARETNIWHNFWQDQPIHNIQSHARQSSLVSSTERSLTDQCTFSGLTTHMKQLSCDTELKEHSTLTSTSFPKRDTVNNPKSKIRLLHEKSNKYDNTVIIDSDIWTLRHQKPWLNYYAQTCH